MSYVQSCKEVEKPEKPLNQLNWKHENLFEKTKCLKASLQLAQDEVDKDPLLGVRYWGDDVAKQIVTHFQEFLGVTKPVVPFEKLGNIVQLKLSKEDAEAMTVEV
ncbi:hypothetical protein Tco_0287115 [Tanacetum coccineum]